MSDSQRDVRLRPHLYGLGYPRQPSPRVTLGELTFHLFLGQVQRTVYTRITNSSRGGETTRGASCLTSPSRVTLAGGANFPRINTPVWLAYPGRFYRATCHVTSVFFGFVLFCFVYKRLIQQNLCLKNDI